MGTKADLSGLKLDDALKHLERDAGKRMVQFCQEARREFGEEGKGITITPLSTPRRRGNNLTFAEIKYPSEEVATKFQAILKRKMR